MNVRFAVQLLSRSVADAIDFLRTNAETGFTNTHGLSKFIRINNDLFDVFNTKEINESSDFKTAVTKTNSERIFDFFDEAIPYIKTLIYNGKPIIESGRKHGFISLITNMHCIRGLYLDYVENDKLPYLATFFLMQDQLESLFGRVRSCYLGANDNPSMQQFASALRKIVTTNEIKASELANCCDSLNILTVSSSKKTAIAVKESRNTWPLLKSDLDTIIEEEEHDIEFQAASDRSIQNQRVLGKFENVSISFVAGIIEKKIGSSRHGCPECDPILDAIFDVNIKVNCQCVENAATQIPCLFDICERAHHVFTRHCIQHSFSINYDNILKDTYKDLATIILYEESDFSHNLEHKRFIINFVTEEYIRMHATYVAKCLTSDEQAKMYRNYLKKKVHFYGQWNTINAYVFHRFQILKIKFCIIFADFCDILLFLCLPSDIGRYCLSDIG